MSVKWVGVLPFAYYPYYQACRATMSPDFQEHVLFIDDTNSETRIGIMKAHNQGVIRMREVGADWLVIISAAIRFDDGGDSFVKMLEDHSDYHVLHAATANVIGGLQHRPEVANQKNGIFGWHLTAFNRSVFDAIGVWDESFSPYGGDDIDISLRIRKGVNNVRWDTFPVLAHDTTMSHSINLGGVKSAFPPRDSYFRRKWGRGTGEYLNDGYAYPFNDPTKSLAYWPQPDDPLSIHQVEFKSGEWTYND